MQSFVDWSGPRLIIYAAAYNLPFYGMRNFFLMHIIKYCPQQISTQDLGAFAIAQLSLAVARAEKTGIKLLLRNGAFERYDFMIRV